MQDLSHQIISRIATLEESNKGIRDTLQDIASTMKEMSRLSAQIHSYETAQKDTLGAIRSLDEEVKQYRDWTEKKIDALESKWRGRMEDMNRRVDTLESTKDFADGFGKGSRWAIALLITAASMLGGFLSQLIM